MNNELRVKSPTVFSEKTYADEPIMRTASQLKGYEPSRYREMRRINFNAYEKGWSAEHVFYEQAKFMESFEDDYDYRGLFSSYFPTYTAMSPEQLRGYFSWRAKVRKGEYRQAGASFAFVYMYELLNLIGVQSPQEAFGRLFSFYKAYSSFAPELTQYVDVWLKDLIAFYELDISEYAAYCDLSFEKNLSVILNCDTADAAELFAALYALSSYDITLSPFYEQYPSETAAAVCAAFREMNGKYEKNHKNTFAEKLFGRICSMPYTVFGSAVFFDRTRVKDHQTTLCDHFSYSFMNGQCFCSRCWGKRGKSAVLGGYIKYLESVLRSTFGFEKTLTAESPAKPFVKIAENAAARALEAYTAQKRAMELRYVDTSALDSILRAADKTREKLITEDELEQDRDGTEPPSENTAGAPEIVSRQAAPVIPEEKTEAANGIETLNAAENAFIRCLIQKSDMNACLKENGLKLSLVCDSVNEKLYDIFCDTVICFDGEIPYIIPDYEEELKEKIS